MASYSEWIRNRTTDAGKKKGTTMFTLTRCHFRLDDNGKDEIVSIGDDYIVVTHRNLKRSFHLSLFSLVEVREFKE